MNNQILRSRYSVIGIILITVFFVIFNKEFNYYGIPLMIFGSGLYIIAMREMGKGWTIEVKLQKKLITSGPFKYIRHPMYTGLLLTCTGLGISLQSIFYAMFLIGIFYPFIYYRAKLEEHICLQSFPEYQAYFQQTNRFFPKLI